MQFFRLKNNKNHLFKSIILRTRAKKYDKEIDTYISKVKPIMILGKAASGKSKQLGRLWDNKESIWDKNKYNFIWFSGIDSITEILYKNIKDNDSANFAEDKYEEYLEEDIAIDDYINKQYMRIMILIEKAKNSILFIDDADKLTGKKLEIIKDMLRNCKTFVLSAEEDTTINKTIYQMVLRKKPTIIDLNSETSYDGTNILLVIFILGLFGTGMYELAMLVMAARFALKGMGKK